MMPPCVSNAIPKAIRALEQTRPEIPAMEYPTQKMAKQGEKDRYQLGLLAHQEKEKKPGITDRHG